MATSAIWKTTSDCGSPPPRRSDQLVPEGRQRPFLDRLWHRRLTQPSARMVGGA
jgi:hypothetical protein